MPAQPIYRFEDEDLLLHLETLQQDAGVEAFNARAIDGYCTEEIPFGSGWEFCRHPIYDDL